MRADCVPKLSGLLEQNSKSGEALDNGTLEWP